VFFLLYLTEVLFSKASNRRNQFGLSLCQVQNVAIWDLGLNERSLVGWEEGEEVGVSGE
jgi:hypothetical protein